MTAWQTFHETIDRRHEYARKWKETTGGKVLGYLCTYIPEEIIDAAGVLPVRIIGSHEPQDVTERHMYSMLCSFSRDCLAQGLLGRYDYLDGLVVSPGCTHMQHAIDSWKRHVPLPYTYQVLMPTHTGSTSARSYLPKELGSFRTSLEEWTGKAVSNQAIQRSIEVYDTNRRLMSDIYELRKADTLPLSGVEAMEMVLSGMLMDKVEHNRLLEQAQNELDGRETRGGGKVRLILVGSEVDDPKLLGLIETLGGEIVIDDNCIGTRYFWNRTAPNHDPLTSIANRYLDRPPCPLYDMGGERRRPGHILRMAQDYRVQGAILAQLQFCDPHEYDMPSIKAVLEGNGIPTLKLEYDMTLPVGQLRTRVEAYLEMLEMSIA